MFKLLATKILIFTLLSYPVYAQFDKKCQLDKISYLSPIIGGCTFRIDNSGKASFKNNNRDVNADQCFSNFLKGKELVEFKKQILDMQKGFNPNIRENPILYLVEENGGYSGKLSNKTLGMGSFDIPYMKKSFGGNAKILLDNGLTIHLKINNNAKLSLIGGFGRVNMSGPCKPININSNSVLNKTKPAETKCRELGFKNGTESFGNCVLKLMN
jgi:hypothetical protein